MNLNPLLTFSETYDICFRKRKLKENQLQDVADHSLDEDGSDTEYNPSIGGNL